MTQLNSATQIAKTRRTMGEKMGSSGEGRHDFIKAIREGHDAVLSQEKPELAGQKILADHDRKSETTLKRGTVSP